VVIEIMWNNVVIEIMWKNVVDRDNVEKCVRSS